MKRAAPREYDLDSLLRAGRVTNPGRAFNLSSETIADYRANGMPEATADRLAVKLGFHPADVWGNWFRESPSDVMFARLALQRAEYLRRVS